MNENDAPQLGEEKAAPATSEAVDVPEEIVVNLVLEIPHVRWYSLANDERRLLAEGPMQIVGPPETEETPQSDEVLVFAFPQTETVQYAVSNVFPVMRVADGNYVFPSESEFYGLVIPGEIDPDIVAAFEELLADFSNLRVAEKTVAVEDLPEVKEEDAVAQAGHKMAHYIRQGAVVVTKGIRHGSKVATIGIHTGKEKLKGKIDPADVPVHVSQDALNALNQANAASGVAVKVSGAVLVGAIAAANHLSNQITGSLAKTPVGQAVSNRPSGTKASAAKDIVKSTLNGALTLYDEVAQAGLVLVQETGNATAELIEHRFGSDAGLAAQQVAQTVNNASQVSVNVGRLGKSALFKRVAANATVDVLSTEEEREANQAKRITIDPATGMQAVMLASQLDGLKAEKANQIKHERQEFIGLVESGEEPAVQPAAVEEAPAVQEFVAIGGSPADDPNNNPEVD